MKPLKNLSAIVIISSGLIGAGCESPLVDNERVVSNGAHLHALFEIADVTQALDDFSAPAETQVSFSGIGESNLGYLGTFQIVQTHINKPQKNADYFTISQGSFEIIRDYANTLYGSYSGVARVTTADYEAEINLVIEGGTGEFEGVSGILSEVIRLQPTGNVQLGEIRGRLQMSEVGNPRIPIP